MRKKWFKSYFLIGTLIVIILALIAGFAFVQNNIKQMEQKRVFESIYNDTRIDFIIPSPADSQISELEANDAIKSVTPYYETATAAQINGVAANGTTLMFPYQDKMEQTPYCKARIIQGEKQNGVGNAIVDRAFADNNHCKVGDQIQLTLNNASLEYIVTAVAETNTYYNGGTVAFILTESDALGLLSHDARYSAAYVEAANITACKTFLEKEYKPLGRLKNKADFSSEDAYNQHVKNFSEADWSKEITNCAANFDSLRVKYANVDNASRTNLIIAAVIIALGIIIFNAVIIKSGSLQKTMREVILKKSGTKKNLMAFFARGIVLNLITFAALYAGLYILIAKNNGTAIMDYFIQLIIPISSALFASIIMMISAKIHVESAFSTKKKL